MTTEHVTDERLNPAVKRLAEDASLFGRMNDPVASAHVRGQCGDEMEFYLVVRDRIIVGVRYYTEGCLVTRACAAAVAKSARGLAVDDALGINPRDIRDMLAPLPPSHAHCPILAVITFYKAVADYLLQP